MLLFLTAIDAQQERRFSCLLDELDAIFEFLNQVVAKGDSLIEAHLMDDEQPARDALPPAYRMPLPTAAFDGVSCLPALRQIELEWTAILAEPLRSSLPSDTVDRRWYQETIRVYEQRITGLELLITDVNRLHQRAENAFGSSNNPYQAVLTRYESQLRKAHRLRHQLLEHL